jgi:hypothetical protein
MAADLVLGRIESGPSYLQARDAFGFARTRDDALAIE